MKIGVNSTVRRVFHTSTASRSRNAYKSSIYKKNKCLTCKIELSHKVLSSNLKLPLSKANLIPIFMINDKIFIVNQIYELSNKKHLVKQYF